MVSGLMAGVLALMSADTKVDALPKGFIEKTIKDEEGEHKYVVFVPEDRKTDAKWPVILFLHGSGERGKDNRKQVRVGLGPAIAADPARCQAIAVFPQAESTSRLAIEVWTPKMPDGKRALRILESVMNEYGGDEDRVYLTGLSMGGFGAWAHAIARPDRWAAVVPVCGGGRPNDVAKIAHLPIWCFHGAADPVVPVGLSRKMIDALRVAGGEPRYTEYEKVGHDSWVKAYADPKLWDWMLAQKRQQSRK